MAEFTSTIQDSDDEESASEDEAEHRHHPGRKIMHGRRKRKADKLSGCRVSGFARGCIP